jgi:hypothetical protein
MRKISSSLLSKVEFAYRRFVTLQGAVREADEYYETIPGLMVNLDASASGAKIVDTGEVLLMKNLGALGGEITPTGTGPTNLVEEQNNLDIISFVDNPCRLNRNLQASELTLFLVARHTRAEEDLANKVDVVFDSRASSTDGGLDLELFNYFIIPDERHVYTLFSPLPTETNEFWKNGVYDGPYDHNTITFEDFPVISKDEMFVVAARLTGMKPAPADTDIGIGVHINSSFTAQFDLAQLLIYSNTLSTPVIDRVNQELMTKWGIS